MLHSAASDLGLHCWPMSQKWDARLIWVKKGIMHETKFNYVCYTPAHPPPPAPHPTKRSFRGVYCFQHVHDSVKPSTLKVFTPITLIAFSDFIQIYTTP